MQFVFHIDGTSATQALWPSPERLREAAPEADWFHAMGCSLMASEQMREQIISAAVSLDEQGAKISFGIRLPALSRTVSKDPARP